MLVVNGGVVEGRTGDAPTRWCSRSASTPRGSRHARPDPRRHARRNQRSGRDASDAVGRQPGHPDRDHHRRRRRQRDAPRSTSARTSSSRTTARRSTRQRHAADPDGRRDHSGDQRQRELRRHLQLGLRRRRRPARSTYTLGVRARGSTRHGRHRDRRDRRAGRSTAGVVEGRTGSRRRPGVHGQRRRLGQSSPSIRSGRSCIPTPANPTSSHDSGGRQSDHPDRDHHRQGRRHRGDPRHRPEPRVRGRRPERSERLDIIIGGNGPATGNVITGVEWRCPRTPTTTTATPTKSAPIRPAGSHSFTRTNLTTGAAIPNGGSTVDQRATTVTSRSTRTAPQLPSHQAAGGVQDTFTYTLTDATETP